ncbi:MAG: hypothetical protein M3O70_03120 [Actinomycetota bacterium]|nr:hypothetical protein [Actinomycetota bacterium]
MHPAAMNIIAMGVGGGVLLLALSVVTGETFTVPREAVTWGAQGYLVLAGSIGVFWLYVFVLRGWTASAASYQLVLIPLVTVPVSGCRMSRSRGRSWPGPSSCWWACTSGRCGLLGRHGRTTGLKWRSRRGPSQCRTPTRVEGQIWVCGVRPAGQVSLSTGADPELHRSVT